VPPTTRTLAAGPRTRAGWAGIALNLGLVIGVVVQLVPLLAFPTVMTQDGPAHLDGGWVIASWRDSGTVGAVLHQNYRLDFSPVPNMVSTFLLAGLVRILSPDSAERVMVVALVVALVAAVGYAARGVDRRAGWLALGALPLAGSRLMAFGFYNFGWGVVGAVLVLGLALRRSAGWSARATAGLALLLTGTWLSHLLPFAVAAGGLCVLGLARVRSEARTGTPLRVAARRHLVPALLAVLPSAVLTVFYLRSGEGPAASAAAGAPSLDRVLQLADGHVPFVVGYPREWPFALATMVALAVLVVAALARRRAAHPGASITARTASRPERPAIAVLLIGSAAVVCLTPTRLGVDFGFLVDRAAWFPVLLALLWAATRPPGPRIAVAVGAVLFVAASGAAIVRLPEEAAQARDVKEFLSVAPVVARGSTLVALQYVPYADPRTGGPDPVRHLASRLVLRTGSVDVGHYEAGSPYFQVVFAGAPSIHAALEHGSGRLEAFPPRVDLAAVRGRLDYVLVVGLDRAGAAARSSASTRTVLSELAAHYDRVATSRPTGMVTVWRARDGSASGSAAGGASGSAGDPVG
jgi:hypothetical protein